MTREEWHVAATSPHLHPEGTAMKSANDPTDAVPLIGYLGKSGRDDYWRVYLTPELREYVEVHENDIVRRQGRPPDESPVDGSVLWVKATAQLVHSRLIPGQAQADFLRGPLTATGAVALGTTNPFDDTIGVYYPRTYQAICSLLTYHPDTCWRHRRT
jgi:hypothetical protein